MPKFSGYKKINPTKHPELQIIE